MQASQLNDPWTHCFSFLGRIVPHSHQQAAAMSCPATGAGRPCDWTTPTPLHVPPAVHLQGERKVGQEQDVVFRKWMLHLDGNRRLLLYTRAGGAEGGKAAWKNGVRLKVLRFEEKGKDGIRG